MEKYVTFKEYQDILSKRKPTIDELGDIVRDEFEGVKLPFGVKSVVQDYKTYAVREDDVWLVTYPKAGTSWTQEIISAVMHDGDLEAVNKRNTVFRVLYLEMPLPESIRKPKNLPAAHKVAEELPSPRVLKSHVPGQLLPPQIWEKKPKIVYVMRNPKDMIVSFFYFMKIIVPSKKEIAKPFVDFFDDMLNDKLYFGPWWEHYLYFWRRRHEENILILRFEDMKRDLRGNVEKISIFLGKKLSDATLNAITEHCTFSNMKTNPMANVGTLFAEQQKRSSSNLMRKGIVGDWKSHFTVAQNEVMDALIRDKLAGTGLNFDFN